MTINQNNRWASWAIFGILSLIWGSSFILMKKGLYRADGSATLSAYQVAALRMLSAGVVLFPLAFKNFKSIPKEKYGTIILTGFLGSFIPAFLFCIAETKIDSALAGFLNALTPIMTILVGVLFYKMSLSKGKLWGVFIAFTGMCILFLANQAANFQHLSYTGFVLIATICYGLNVNLAHQKLHDISATTIAAASFAVLIPPSLIVLWLSGYFSLPLHETQYLVSTTSASTLGILGTAIASILFYMLLKKAGAVFASMVTYGVPFIALCWGLADGESVGLIQTLGLAVILGGVYISNKK